MLSEKLTRPSNRWLLITLTVGLAVAVALSMTFLADADAKKKKKKKKRHHAPIAVVTPTPPPTPPPTLSDKLPDLGMAQLGNLKLDNSNGRSLLRFDATIVNVGAGPFEAHGSNPNSNNNPITMDTVTQRIYNNAGSYRDVPTVATMFYAGDGHTHWHVKNLESYELDRSDNGVKVGTGAKSGFCFYDIVRYRLTLPGAPQSSAYTGCANGQPAAPQVAMGLSVGWGDLYSADLPDQYIDVTGLSAGRYRLKATADPSNWFTESNGSNNTTWVDIQIQGNGVNVVGYGPNA